MATPVKPRKKRLHIGQFELLLYIIYCNSYCQKLLLWINTVVVITEYRKILLITYTIQYNTTSFISNIEHHYITTANFTQHRDGWKGGGQTNNLIAVHPQH